MFLRYDSNIFVFRFFFSIAFSGVTEGSVERLFVFQLINEKKSPNECQKSTETTDEENQRIVVYLSVRPEGAVVYKPTVECRSR